jgi:transposase
MSESEEDIFIKPFLESAKDGGILEVSRIHSAYEKKLGRNIKKSVVYRLLHRHDWRKIAPRPTHPKMDKDAQDTFKKTGLQS